MTPHEPLITPELSPILPRDEIVTLHEFQGQAPTEIESAIEATLRITHYSAPLVLVLVSACALAPSAGRRSTPDVLSSGRTASAIDSILAAAYGPGQPGATAIVVKDGRVLLRKGYGLANAELGVAMRPDAVMAIASLSKSFTAAGILALAEQGKLSLQDDIRRFLPGYPARGATITIEHLLTHTSGISGLADTSDLRAAAAPEVTVTDLAGDWVRDLPPDAAPGAKWAYSNWGYDLLAAVIERASGQGYPEFLQRTFFDPLGMRRTYYADRRRVIPWRATGYDQQPDAVFNVLAPRGRMIQPNGASGWLSTVDDLARWSAALDDGRVLSRESIARMFTPYHLSDGTSTGYGYGWDLGEYAGHRVQEHQGGTAGFLADIIRMPDDHILVVILSNRYSMTPPLQTTAHRVAAVALGRPIADPVPIPASAGVLEGLAGTYRGGDVGTVVVTVGAGSLVAQIPGLGRVGLVPVAPGVFRARLVTWTFSFETDTAGRGTRVRIRDWKLDDTAERVAPASSAPQPIVAVAAVYLDACAGVYEALNGVLVTVERAGNHLVVRPFAENPVEVFPTSTTAFVTRDGTADYRFQKDSSGRVSGYQRTAGGRSVPARRLGCQPGGGPDTGGPDAVDRRGAGRQPPRAGRAG
jgi:CubicO group peptidase (beta-lactamase class C family)